MAYIFTVLLLQASLIAQLVKNLPAMQETWVRFLGQEDRLEKEMATRSSILAWRINPMDRGAWRASVHGVARVGHDLATKPPPYIYTHGYIYMKTQANKRLFKASKCQ